MGFGDELMVSGRARVMQQTDPRKVMVTYKGKRKWLTSSAVLENNPRIAAQDERGDFQELEARDKVTNMRPYHTGKTAERWTYNLAFRADVGELYFSFGERSAAARYSPKIVIEPTIKAGASPNKNWGWSRWLEFSRLARAAGYELTQLGPRGSSVLPGVRYIETPDFRQACAVLANARAYVGHEGGTHHAAAALNVPGVVIFGGFTPVELTGYPMHRNLGASLGDACGMRVKCAHCEAAMAAITPGMVLDELRVIV